MAPSLKPTIKFTKKSTFKSAVSSRSGVKATPGSFELRDNENGSFTVFGADAAGVGGIDISGVASAQVTSDAPTVLTADSPVGMTGTIHGVIPGTANLTIVVTWNDSSIGPFTVTVPCTVKQGPVTGLDVEFGTPTVRV